MSEAGFLRCIATVEQNGKIYRGLATAAFLPETIKPTQQEPADFLDFIRGQVLEHESGKLDHLETELREDTESPDFWRNDLETYIAHVREALTRDDFDIPFDLKGQRSDEENRTLMRELFIRYGQLLQVWPSIVSITREIHASGFESTLTLAP